MALRPRSMMRDFIRSGAAGGIILMAAAALALIVANSPLGDAYLATLNAYVGPLSVQHWINDGLMALFFMLVGLEMKRELVDGHLSRWSDRALPAVAAVAGMVAPAIVYLAIVRDAPALHRGWAIPAATDIAFAVGVLALLGRNTVPPSLTLLLTSIAIIDDLGAVLVIALFYTAGLDLVALAAGAAIYATMLVLARRGVTALTPYLLLGAGLWVATYLSGVHATIAGVLTGLAIPLRASPGRPDDAGSPLHRLEHGIQPWVAFGIVPLFGFANAGLPLGGIGREILFAPLTLGVALGLFLGKQIGVLGSVRAAVALGIAQRPVGANWRQVHGIALLCGVGFTMSLFVGGLAFRDPLLADEVKLGVLMGSLASALAGYAVLRLAKR